MDYFFGGIEARRQRERSLLQQGSSRPSGSPDNRSSENGVSDKWIVEVGQLVIGFLTIFLLLAYPLGFLVVLIQIGNTHDYDYTMARYAASLAPTSVVAAKVIIILVYASLCGVLMLIIFAVQRIAMRCRSCEANWRWLAPTGVMVGFALPLTFPAIRPLTGLVDSEWHRLYSFTIEHVLYAAFSDKVLLIACGVFILLGALVGTGVYCGKVGPNLPKLAYPWNDKFWKEPHFVLGTITMYVAALLAAVSLSAMHGPNLPEVQLYLKDETPDKLGEVYLLSVSNETWYVIDKKDGTTEASENKEPLLLAVPADGVSGTESVIPDGHTPVLPLEKPS